MPQHYSNPRRETAPSALPDLETFRIGRQDRDDCPICQEEAGATAAEHRRDHTGWYWWLCFPGCFPGCLPDGDAFGPFATEAEAPRRCQIRPRR